MIIMNHVIGISGYPYNCNIMPLFGILQRHKRDVMEIMINIEL